jgi:hypothetical protein
VKTLQLNKFPSECLSAVLLFSRVGEISCSSPVTEMFPKTVSLLVLLRLLAPLWNERKFQHLLIRDSASSLLFRKLRIAS